MRAHLTQQPLDSLLFNNVIVSSSGLLGQTLPAILAGMTISCLAIAWPG